MQVAVDFVGGDVVEAEGSALVFRLLFEIGAGGFEQGEGADDIGLDKFACAVYAAVNVAFGGQVHDGAGLVLREDALERGTVADVGVFKGVTRGAGHGGEGLEVAGVGEFVEVDDALAGVLDQVADKGGADKAGAAGDEEGHGAGVGLVAESGSRPRSWVLSQSAPSWTGKSSRNSQLLYSSSAWS